MNDSILIQKPQRHTTPNTSTLQESRKRSVVKAVTYRSLATIATFVLALSFTGDLEIATSIGLLDFVVKFAIYYLNERAWTFSSWGYIKKKES